MRVHGPDDCERKRAHRLETLNRLLTFAVVVFVLATALAVVAYLVVWP